MLLKDPTGLSENENDRRLLISYHIIKIYTILREREREREREKRVRVPLIILSNNVVCGFKSVYIYIYIYMCFGAGVRDRVYTNERQKSLSDVLNTK